MAHANSIKDISTALTRTELSLLLNGRIVDQPDRILALILLDLSNFHDVNTSLGYSAGERLVAQVGKRIQDEFRNVDTVTPAGFGELAVILPELKNENHALLAAKKIQRLLGNTTFDHDTSLTIRSKMGIAVYPFHGTEAEIVLRKADVALHEPSSCQGQVRVATRSSEHVPNSMEMISALESAIEENALELVFQPQIDLRSGRTLAVEALSRWHDENFGHVAPDKFISIAENFGLIKPLTVWSINAGLKNLRAWESEWADGRMAINLSASLLNDSELVELVRRAFKMWGVSPEKITFEVTESAIMSNPEQCMSTLDMLRNLGVSLSIDDFGTGYSSMAYLSRLPVDEIKIDKSFVMNMSTDDDNARIVRTIIDLAHNMELQVVAEGIEDDETLQALIALECDYAQGYFLSMPRPSDEVLTMCGQQVSGFDAVTG